jgi:hypothetical protein
MNFVVDPMTLREEKSMNNVDSLITLTRVYTFIQKIVQMDRMSSGENMGLYRLTSRVEGESNFFFNSGSKFTTKIVGNI